MARRLTTNQEILGSIPSVFIFVLLLDITVPGPSSFHHLLPSTAFLLFPFCSLNHINIPGSFFTNTLT
jgi:hypothetical protein